MVISVGYRTNSDRAIQFRRWATYILKEFSKKGYIIDKKRMANGVLFDEDCSGSLFQIIIWVSVFLFLVVQFVSNGFDAIDVSYLIFIGICSPSLSLCLLFR